METVVTTRVGRFRWTICGLLFLAATINYVDRQVIGLLKPTLQTEFGWSELDYADIAELLDVPVGTVKSRIHDMVKRLREEMAG